MLLNPFGSRDAPAKHVILRHGELSTAPEKARQIRSDSLQRSSEDCFHQAYRRSERGGGLNSESGFLSALRTSLRFIPFELMLLTTVGSLAEASLLSKKNIQSTSVSCAVALGDTFLHHGERGHCGFYFLDSLPRTHTFHAVVNTHQHTKYVLILRWK